MLRPRIAILTYAALPDLFLEEQASTPALAAAGVDYFERIAELKAWLDRVEASGIPLVNSASLVRWNLDKVYLLELAARGVKIIPTLHFKGGPSQNLTELLEQAGWDRAVIKPAISGCAFRTYVVDRGTAAVHQAEAQALQASVGLLVQPFLPEIGRVGEHSLIFFNGVFSHAVLKKPVPNEFRVQIQFGGTASGISPTPKMIQSAERVLAALPEAPLYARVDGVVLGEELHLMEVELIEPYLYLDAAPGSAATYVATLARTAYAMGARFQKRNETGS